jgi:hypothetical protein
LFVVGFRSRAASPEQGLVGVLTKIKVELGNDTLAAVFCA